MSSSSGRRQWWAVDKDVVDRAEADVVCRAVLRVVRPRADRVEIDVLSDHEDVMPDEVREVQRWLMGKRRSVHTMSAEVDTAHPASWRAVEVYGSWSISVGVWSADVREIADFHDSGCSVTALLNDDEAAMVAAEIADVGVLLPLDIIRQRARVERRARRRASWRRPLGRR